MGAPQATAMPVSLWPAATATLIDPFPPQLTFYEESSSISNARRQLWFNTKGLLPEKVTMATDWFLALPSQEAVITSSKEDTPSVPVKASFTFNPLTNAEGGGSLTFSAQSQITPGVVSVQAKATVTTVSTSTKPITMTGTTDNGSVESTLAPTGSSSASSSNTSIPTLAPKRDGIKPGAAAGIGIGCLLAGALIAGLLVWFCMKRKRPSSGMRDSEASTVALMHREKGPVAKAVTVSSGSPIASALENGLPQPLEDKLISGEISKISNLIKNHVQSYYHSRAVSPGMIDYDDLQALGENLPVSVGTLSTLLNNSATREIALRFVLAWVLTSRIQLIDSSNITFLPPEVAKCVQSMNQAEHGSRVHSLFYAKWRALTAELLQPTYVRNPFSATDGRIRNIQAAANLLDSVLRPFADSRMDDGARSRNLEEMLKRSAQFAFTLFSQPTAWNFDWQNEQTIKSGSLCIFPALVQVADENGEPLHTPRPFSEAVNRRLDE